MFGTTKTTDLDIVRKERSRFTWGTVLEVHDVGRYTIIEYRQRDNEEAIFFHVYVDGKSTSNSTTSLDGALLIAIAMSNLEPNEARYMAMGASKLLNVKEE